MKPGGVQYRNMAEEAHLLLSAVKTCGGKFGLGVPIDVLRGSKVRFLLAIILSTSVSSHCVLSGSHSVIICRLKEW